MGNQEDRKENLGIDWIRFEDPVDYAEAITETEKKRDEIIEGRSREAIFLLEHKEIYTAGVSSSPEEVIDKSIIPVPVNRGGKITYHGKGQRIVYPILSLEKRNSKDLKLYVNFLEEWVIKTLGEFGIKAYRAPGKVGVWTKKDGEDAKISSIGIRIKKWVTSHGISVNMYNDLSKFNAIIPCGLAGSKQTSFKDLGIEVDSLELDGILKKTFYRLSL